MTIVQVQFQQKLCNKDIRQSNRCLLLHLKHNKLLHEKQILKMSSIGGIKQIKTLEWKKLPDHQYFPILILQQQQKVLAEGEPCPKEGYLL